MAGRHDDKGFLSRWAARKRDAQRGEPAGETGPDTDPGDETSLAARQSGETPGPEAEADFDVKDLPDIETLDKDADFSVFMNEKVPEALRRRALRRLWKIDPVFGFRDGMNDYDEDYTDAALVVEGVKTIYQVGKGMLTPEDSEESDRPGPEGAAAGEEPGETAVPSGDAASSPAEAGGPGEHGPEEAVPAESATADAPEQAAGGQLAGEQLADKQFGGPPVGRQGPLEPAPATVSKGKKSAIRRRWGDASG